MNLAGVRGEFGREGIALSPDGTILEEFLFPDRDCLLEGVDKPAARIEGGGAVGGCDSNENTGFTDLETTKAMNEDEIADGKIRKSPGGKHLHLGKRHVRIGVVKKVKGAAALAVVADDAVEEDNGSVFAAPKRLSARSYVDGVVSKGDVETGR